MVKRSMAEGQRIIRRLIDQLDDPKGLAHEYAEAVLVQAVQNASSKPTPQARMAASVMQVRDDRIVPAGVASDAVEVGQGSEFGSSLYPQFHAAHNPRGYWLLPAGEQTADSAAADQALEDVMNAVIRSPF